MPAPANDNYENALIIPAGGGTSSAITIDEATRQGFEPGQGIDPYKTIWWKFTAGATVIGVYVDTFYSLAGDAPSGDGIAGYGSFGHLDTKLQIWTGDDAPTATFGSGNDDAIDPEGGYWSEKQFNVTEGVTYWVQVGTYGADYVGTVILEWFNVPGPPLVYNEYEIDCPTYVNYNGHGSWSNATYPSVDNMLPDGQISDGYLEVYQVGANAGDLLVMAVGTTMDGVLSAPSGWTELCVESWGGTRIFSPTVPSASPYWYDHAVVGVWWKLADGTEVDDVLETTFTGFEYNQNGNSPLTVAGGTIYRFQCQETGESNQVAFPSPPILYAGIDSANPQLIADQGEVSSPTTANEATFPTAVADHSGNHLYFQLGQIKGYEWVVSSDEDARPTYPDLLIQPGPGDFGIPNGQHGPAFWEGAQVWAFADAQNALSSLAHIFTDSLAPGAIRTYVHPNAWADGFIGTEGVDFDVWAVLPGIAALSFVIMAPESARPFNDVAASALNVSCPALISECNFGALTETSEQVEGFDPEKDLWFKFTASETETVAIYTDDSTYDTVIAVYDSDFTLIDSDDEGGDTFQSSRVDLSATSGETYYIQVIGKGGDYGLLHLAVDCTGGALVAYWGINAALAV